MARENISWGYERIQGVLTNIAILARYLQKQHGLQNILILDWDVHLGACPGIGAVARESCFESIFSVI
ncbi:MAG: hypothetical protein GY792_25635 [Gammaproteobacteria bacterium]|nr:hypothetical protein [Gammaproteobacteria bacterium]